jgi:hypothetical protein
LFYPKSYNWYISDELVLQGGEAGAAAGERFAVTTVPPLI